MQTEGLTSAASAGLVPLAQSIGGKGLSLDGADGTGSGEVPFAGLMREAVANLKELEDKASSTVEGLVSGKGVDVHEAMIATQKADLAFELALAVRGKAVSAYQTMMGLQF